MNLTVNNIDLFSLFISAGGLFSVITSSFAYSDCYMLFYLLITSSYLIFFDKFHQN